ncbi:MAG: adenosylmethionine decarboxylase [Candidatus Aenigmarchaeota archaeon]|nr:adenosylmethionine decarboxylase [Candidatus Aenigmarchaeota archaeon]
MRYEKGTHALVEIWVKDGKLLDNILFIKDLMKKAIKESGLKKIYVKFHKFQPQGLTAFALLVTSHISFHSWPEHKYATLDIYACDKEEKVLKALDVFLKALKPTKVKKEIIKRGYIYNGNSQ